MGAIARVHVIISGQVQGVFYRAWAKSTAQKLGLFCKVENLESGQVKAVFEGNIRLVERMIKKCFTGPPLAKVEKIEVIWK